MKTDGRVHSHENLEFIRFNAVQRIQAGELVSDVMASFGLTRTAAYPWLRKAKKHGIESLRSTKSPGPEKILTEEERRMVRTWICGHDPRQYGIDFGLWTRSIVQILIKDRLGKDISISSIGVMLAELNITPQKPLQRAYQRNPRAIANWKELEYPIIKMQCNQAKGHIFFLDEAGFCTDDTRGTTWGKRGVTPIIKTDGKRQRVNAISAVSPNGSFWHNVYDGKLTSAVFIEFLIDLLKRQRGPIFLILDSLPLHKSKSVQEFVNDNAELLKLFFLPTYAPDLNPDELVWNYMKGKGTVKIPLRVHESLKQRVVSDLKNIQKSSRLVKSFFQASCVRYAAA